MNYESTASAIANHLDKEKKAFLEKVRQSIYDHIEGEGLQSIAVVEKSQVDGKIRKTWHPKANLEYVRILLKFCRGKDHEEMLLDSYLTDPIIDIVVAKFQRLYERQAQPLSRIVLAGIFEDQDLTRSFVLGLLNDYEETASLTPEAKAEAIALIQEQLNDIINGHSDTIDEMTFETVSLASAGVIARKVAVVLLNQLSIYTAFGFAKLLALPLIVQIITFSIKKVVILSIIAAIIQLIGVKIGIGAMGGILLAVTALVAWWVVYDVKAFPRRLGRRVSNEIAEGIGNQYHVINTSIGGKVMENMASVGIQEMAVELKKNKELAAEINNLINALD